MVGLSEKRKALVVELSRGMRQRLMLAKTLMPNPRVLLLDEPASGVDPQGRIELKNILRRLAEERRTVLISSHILTEMDEFCTSVAIMERGEWSSAGGSTRSTSGSWATASSRSRCCLIRNVSCRSWRFDRSRAGRSGGTAPSNSGSRAIKEAAGDLLTALVQGGVRVASSSGGETTWKSCSSKSVRRSFRDGLGSYLGWFDNPIFVKHLRSRLRLQGGGQAAIVVVQALCCASRGPGFSSTRVRNGTAFGCLLFLQVVIIVAVGGAQAAGGGGAPDSGILDFHRGLATLCATTRPGVLFRGPDP